MSKLTDLTEVTTLADGDLGMVVDVSNTSMDATGTNSKVTLANVWAYIKTKADTFYQTILVSGTSIKTINSTSLLGSGDIAVGTGNVSKVGTPVNNQVGVWTGDGTLEGDTALTFDTTTDKLTSGALEINGTGGLGFITLVGQASNPSAPAAGTLLLHSSTANGFTRLEQDNEATTNLVYGRDSVVIAKNTSGSTIAKGSVVYVTGSTGNVPNIAKAQANSASTLPSVSIVVDDISNNAFGQVMVQGILSNFDTSAFSSGDRVYVSTSVAGGLTATRPSGTTNFVQRVGTVLVSGVGNGSILVDVAPAILNMETGTNAATWTATDISVAKITTSGNIELGNASDTTLTRVSAGVVSIEGNNIVTNTSSPTLSTITTTGNIELGNASDTTLSRSAAGVLAVEGVVLPSISSTNTITNKRNQPRIVSAASYTTDTGTSLDVSTTDIFVITAQAGALLFNSPSGTPVQGEKLVIRIKDNGTARALTWNAVFRAMGTALPSTTVLSKTLYLGFFYNSTDTKWDLVASAQEA